MKQIELTPASFRQMREERGLSVETVASAIGVSASMVRWWENGQKGWPPRRAYLLVLRRLFKVQGELVAVPREVLETRP